MPGEGDDVARRRRDRARRARQRRADGTPADNELYGGAGDDRLTAARAALDSDGEDLLDGGPGEDWLDAAEFAAETYDHVLCGAGVDTWLGATITTSSPAASTEYRNGVVRRLVLAAALAAFVLPASADAASRAGPDGQRGQADRRAGDGQGQATPAAPARRRRRSSS